MRNVLLLPDASVLALLDITVDASAKTITAVASTISPEVRCPVCQHPSSKVQRAMCARSLTCPAQVNRFAGWSKSVASGV